MEDQESLKDEDTSVDVSEDLGLQDAYYKPKQDLDHSLKTEDPIPFEFYLNEDGFWNNYIQTSFSYISTLTCCSVIKILVIFIRSNI